MMVAGVLCVAAGVWLIALAVAFRHQRRAIEQLRRAAELNRARRPPEP